MHTRIQFVVCIGHISALAHKNTREEKECGEEYIIIEIILCFSVFPSILVVVGSRALFGWNVCRVGAIINRSPAVYKTFPFILVILSFRHRRNDMSVCSAYEPKDDVYVYVSFDVFLPFARR